MKIEGDVETAARRQESGAPALLAVAWHGDFISFFGPKIAILGYFSGENHG